MSQYPNVTIVYRPGKDNVNADALSRLTQLRTSQIPERPDDQEGVYGFNFTVTVVGLSSATLRQFERGYVDDPHFRLIYDTLKSKLDLKDRILAEEIQPDEHIVPSHFTKLDKLTPDDVHYNGFQARIVQGHILLYIVDPLDGHPRLCVPRSCHEIIFKQVHDASHHPGFERIYKRLRPSFYIRNLSALLRTYVSTCPACQRNNPVRHKPYGQLQPLSLPSQPFEMVTLDLVVKLPPSKLGDTIYDSFMSITDRLTKWVTVILGREDWSALNWANAFYKKYYCRWGVPQRILTDRGKVFLSDFWTSLFKILRTNLLVTTSYHLQTDGQSERTNQIIEIALRHVVAITKTDWTEFIEEVEFNINNNVNLSTGLSPMQFLTGLNTPNILHTAIPGQVCDRRAIEWTDERSTLRQQARDSLLFAQTKMSIYYDRKHQPVTLKAGDKAYIKLANGIEPGYKIANSSGKLYQLRVGPFEIIEPVGRLAYRLKLPSTWRIHPVISIAHLQPHRDDPHGREEPPPPPDLDVEGEEVFEVEAILAKRYNKRRKRHEWRIKWKGYGPEQTTWEPIEHLRNSQTLVDHFEHTGAISSENTSAIVNFASTLFLQTRPPPTNPYYCTNLLPDDLGPLYTPSPPPPTHIPRRRVRSVRSFKLTEA